MTPFLLIAFNSLVLVVALRFACTEKVKKKSWPQLKYSRFSKLICSIYYFSELYKIFKALDVIPDKRLYVGEFTQINQRIDLINGLRSSFTVTDASKKTLEEEFLVMDEDKNGIVRRYFLL